MGGRKFRLARHRKNKERKKKISQVGESGINLSATSQLLTEPTFIISLPLDAFTNGTVTTRQDLSSQIMKSTLLPSPWLMASTNPLVFCKLRVPRDVDHGCGAWVNISLTLHEDLKWSLFEQEVGLDTVPFSCYISYPFGQCLCMHTSIHSSVPSHLIPCVYMYTCIKTYKYIHIHCSLFSCYRDKYSVC